MQSAIERLAETGREEVEYRQRSKNGDYRWLSNHTSLTRDAAGRPTYRNGNIRDITEQKRTQMAREEQAMLLEEQARLLDEANRELENFSYSVSHDLKAPIRAIDGYSRMILKKYGDQMGEDAVRMLGVIRTSTERMVRLIDDLLSFSRVLRNSMTVAEIDMHKLVSEVWDDTQALRQNREMTIKITKLLPGFGDRGLIRQVLFNLVSNAVKFTKDRTPGSVEISCYAAPGQVVYCLKDNGVGFDMAYYHKLFNVFQRLHGADEFEGTGAGLAIVARIIKRHGGRVWAEGEVDKGACFYFSLPAQKDGEA
jgi:two-component system sensor kinase